MVKKMYRMGFMTTMEPTGSRTTRQTIVNGSMPTILKGKQLKAIPLPTGFDTSVHVKAKETGVKATSMTEMLDLIAVLEGRKPQVG